MHVYNYIIPKNYYLNVDTDKICMRLSLNKIFIAKKHFVIKDYLASLFLIQVL